MEKGKVMVPEWVADYAGWSRVGEWWLTKHAAEQFARRHKESLGVPVLQPELAISNMLHAQIDERGAHYLLSNGWKFVLADGNVIVTIYRVEKDYFR